MTDAAKAFALWFQETRCRHMAIPVHTEDIADAE